MADGDSNTAITHWLKDKGYSEADVQKILAKLAERDHQTMSDSVFDSIGGDGQTLDQIIREALEE